MVETYESSVDESSEKSIFEKNNWVARELRLILAGMNSEVSGFMRYFFEAKRSAIWKLFERFQNEKIKKRIMKVVKNSGFYDAKPKTQDVLLPKPDWTENPRFQCTRTIHFLSKLFENSEKAWTTKQIS